MGGCRCTYRNCTVKTDGKTHMFHYPVFEKVRCHKWLVNARKLEFLNLKVSQLKNRVVCQHHFKPDNFMNYMNDKLTFDAIPTEDGPYCDTTKFNDNNLEEKQYSNLILQEDIESDYLFGNKKANFSLKYGDFLTNGELMDSSRYNANNVENVNSSNYNNCNKQTTPMKPQPAKLALPPKDCAKQEQITKVQKPLNSANLKINKNISQPLNKIVINKGNITRAQPLCQELISSKSEVNVPQINKLQQNSIVNKESKVKILSETEITWPLPITGKFEKISPSTTLFIPEKKRELISETSSSTSKVSNSKESNDFKVVEVLDLEFLPKQETGETVEKNIETSPETPIRIVPQSLRIFPNKSKLTPERVAAIEKKREFNMKLKNVIESCLIKFDDSTKNDEKFNEKNPQKSILKDANVQIDTNTAKEDPMKNFQERTIAFMESRMNKMEETLLSRIDQNSQKIMELKSTFYNTKSKDRKLVNVHTNTGEECYKKFLYREISPYLSENAKNLIYEDLFINKFSVTPTPETYNRKRRKVCF